MRIDLKRNGIILLLFLFGLVIMWLGITGRMGLMLAAILTPEHLEDNSSGG